MSFSIGDKVSFTNEKLEGKVVKILPDNIYRVEIEDGFTLDVTGPEIVLQKTFLAKPPITSVPELRKTSPINKVVDEGTILSTFSSLNGLYFLVIPVDSGVLSGKIQWWLFNASSNDVLSVVSVAGKNKKEKTLIRSLLPSGSATKIEELDRKDFTENVEVIIRLLMCNLDQSISPEYSIRTFQPEFPSLEQTNAKLNSPFCFTRYHQLYEKSVINEEPVSLKELYEKFKPSGSNENKSVPHANTSFTSSKDRDVLKRFGLQGTQLEVDLHIEELVEDISSISAGDMLHHQLSVFRKSLDKALLSRQKNITFIHGTGNGKLRAAIRRELSELGLRYQDAPFEKYGSGATSVLLL